jgi:hypothetical protein
MPAPHQTEHQCCVAESERQQDNHENGQVIPAQIARQMREEQLRRPFYNKFSHNFKLLSFFPAIPKQPDTNYASPSKPHTSMTGDDDFHSMANLP